MRKWSPQPSKKGTGFEQPLKPHEHWHIDIAHINLHGTFYYLCAVLDGASRYLPDWSLLDSMKTADVEILLQRAKERLPDPRPRIISDNGPQFIAKDFKEFIRISGMGQVRTAPYYPQSNGKLERWNESIRSECIRPGVPLSLDDAERPIVQYGRSIRSSDCTAPSAPSRRRIYSTDGRPRSLPRGIANWRWHECGAKPPRENKRQLHWRLKFGCGIAECPQKTSSKKLISER